MLIIFICLGCEIEIWKDYDEGGNHFTCNGFNDGYWCYHNSLGTVGNDEASTIKCSCPVEFDRIVYDTPADQWVINRDAGATGVIIQEIILPNKCNLADQSRCSSISLDTSLSITRKSYHNWGHIFKAGVTYSAEASASLEGLGVKESITISAEESISSGGSREQDQTISAQGKCVAPANSKATCRYMAYKGTVEVGYTIYWKNASPTRGKYIGAGWQHHFDYTVEDN